MGDSTGVVNGRVETRAIDDPSRQIAERIASVLEGEAITKVSAAAGVSAYTLRRYAADAPAQLVTLARVCEHLNINANWLLLGEGPVHGTDYEEAVRTKLNEPALVEILVDFFQGPRTGQATQSSSRDEGANGLGGPVGALGGDQGEGRGAGRSATEDQGTAKPASRVQASRVQASGEKASGVTGGPVASGRVNVKPRRAQRTHG